LRQAVLPHAMCRAKRCRAYPRILACLQHYYRATVVMKVLIGGSDQRCLVPRKARYNAASRMVFLADGTGDDSGTKRARLTARGLIKQTKNRLSFVTLARDG
jgi:hypothetical protein